jgi:hypothetical protein
MAFKKGQNVVINGEKLIVASINDDGTITLNYAKGSGKTGFRGKIVNPDTVQSAVKPKAMFVDSIGSIDSVDDSVSLDYYNNSSSISPKVKTFKDRLDSLTQRGIEASVALDAVTAPYGKKGSNPTDAQINHRLEFLELERDYEDKVFFYVDMESDLKKIQKELVARAEKDPEWTEPHMKTQLANYKDDMSWNTGMRFRYYHP